MTVLTLYHAGWDDDNYTINIGSCSCDVAKKIATKFNKAIKDNDINECVKILKAIGDFKYEVSCLYYDDPKLFSMSYECFNNITNKVRLVL